MRRLWLRWSWRDLRARWLQVVAIALIIGLGSGLYAGLGSTAEWRRQSNDASYAQLAIHDVRVRLDADGAVPAGTLRALVDRLADPSQVVAASERLSVPTQFDASSDERTVLVPGELVGMDPDAAVDKLFAARGQLLSTADAAEPVAMVERNFAKQFGLPDEGTIGVAGGGELRWVGHALAPEWFVVTDPRGGFLAGASYGVVFTSLAAAQDVTGRSGAVNDLVLRVAPGMDRDTVAAELTEVVTAELPVAATVTTTDDVTSYQVLYQDIEGDRAVWNAISLIVLLGAAFAASNLVGRMIEAQRREFGIGMALGVPVGRLVIRPLLVGVQVGVLGVLAGIGVGLGVNAAFRSALDAALPLPVWKTPFQPGTFAAAALLGLVVSVGATLWPVWRVTRLAPVEALSRTRPTAGRTTFAALARRLHVRGPSVRLLPLRDLVRAPRRTLLTALGIAASISVLVGVLGMMDSFLGVVDQAEAELTGGGDPVSVDLTSLVPQTSPVVTSLEALPGVASADPTLVLGGQLRNGDSTVDAVVELAAWGEPGGGWRPSVTAGRLPGQGEILLATKAATDLGVGVGDPVELTHLRRNPDGTTATATSSFVVAGLHANPLRALSYLDASSGETFGLAGVVSQVRLEPQPGVTASELQRAAFGVPGVAAARSARAGTDLLRDMISQYLGLLRVVEAIPIVLALLVAFNATAISADERRRDHATMFAFGLPLRRVVGLLVAESFLLGVIGTGLGIVAGIGLARWVVESVIPDTLPELAISTTLTSGSLIGAALLGVGAVTLAPLFVIRRLRRLDVPSALRVVE